MFCQKCGQDIEDNASACSGCSASSESGKGIGWGILSFFAPIVGLILYFVFKKEKPKASKACLIGTLTGFVINIIFPLFVYFLIIVPDASRRYAQTELMVCKVHLLHIAAACDKWAADNKGRYPSSLSELTPNYLETIPACPHAGIDTYSSSYSSTAYPIDAYTFYCKGSNHSAAGLKENYPQFDAFRGFIEY